MESTYKVYTPAQNTGKVKESKNWFRRHWKGLAIGTGVAAVTAAAGYGVAKLGGGDGGTVEVPEPPVGE